MNRSITLCIFLSILYQIVYTRLTKDYEFGCKWAIINSILAVASLIWNFIIST